MTFEVGSLIAVTVPQQTRNRYTELLEALYEQVDAPTETAFLDLR